MSKPGVPERHSFFIRIRTGMKSCSDIHIGAKAVKSISLTTSTNPTPFQVQKKRIRGKDCKKPSKDS